MKSLIFYEKTGCKGNARQKAMLEAAGYTLEVRSLLDEAWGAAELRSFFGDRPVVDWFNEKAPAIKQGVIDPAVFDAESAIAIMLREPILIRRPLVNLNGQKACGFDDAVQAMLGLQEPATGMEACQTFSGRCD
jgi:nitrogenase-associated protein